jgi:hypothetical protein
LKSLDAGFHRCDDSWAFSTFYDGVVFGRDILSLVNILPL